MISVVALAGAEILNDPSADVCVETLVPFTVTVTFETAEPVLESVTLPDMTFCANAEKALSINSNATDKIFENFCVDFLIKQQSVLV